MEEYIKQLLGMCYSRWSIGEAKDERIKKFETIIGCFIKQFENDDSKIIIGLLNKFEYYSIQRVRVFMNQIYDELVRNNILNVEDTIFLSIETENRINSSNVYTCEFMISNSINKYMCRPQGLRGYKDEELSKIKRIIIIDDFCGSGETLKTFIENNKEKLNGKEIYYIIIHIMKNGKFEIENLNNKNIKINILCYKELDKAFVDEEDNREKFREISKKFGYVKEHDILGYNSTEALVAFYNNTPNNTLGIFRDGNEKNQFPLFPRKYDQKPEYLKNKEKSKKHSSQRYNSNIERYKR